MCIAKVFLAKMPAKATIIESLAMDTLLVLVNLGKMTQIGIILFVSSHPKKPREVGCGIIVSLHCWCFHPETLPMNKLLEPIEIGLEQALFVVLVYFFPHLNMQKTADYGPNNTKNSWKSVIFSYLTMNNIVRILLLL